MNLKTPILICGLAFLAFSCQPRRVKQTDSHTAAAQISQTKGRITITAQKPGDISIASKGSMPKFRDSAGREKELPVFKNDEFTYISLRVALADGLLAWATGKALRHVLLVPRYDAQEASIDVARSEGWSIRTVVLDSSRIAKIKTGGLDASIYCPISITYEKKNGSKYASEFPKDMCHNVEFTP